MRRETPVIRDMTRQEIDELLECTQVARMAYGRRAWIDVFPFHFVKRDGWIYGRTTPGHKLDRLTRDWWVAVEVDAVSGMFEWRSVILHGGFYPLEPGGSARDAARFEAAVDALRTLLPETLAEEDPVPGRTLVFGVAVQEASGRVAELRHTGDREEEAAGEIASVNPG